MPVALSWKSFEESYIQPGVAGLHRAGDSSSAALLFVDAGARKIGTWLPCEHRPPQLPASSNVLDISTVYTQGTLALEVSTTSRECYEAFYSLARDIIARREFGSTPLAAVRDAIEAWRELLRETRRLTPAEEIGLWGELWFLRALQARGASNVLALWTGPLSDPHDFRVGGLEFEVKTSTSPRRIHSISSLEQLQASAEHSLAVISILVAQTDDHSGMSLRDIAQDIAMALPEASHARFHELLRDRHFPGNYDSSPLNTFALRSEPYFIPVDDLVPVLTRQSLQGVLRPDCLLRLVDTTYSVRLDGLGKPLSQVSLDFS